MKKIGILASYNGSGFEVLQKAIEDKNIDAKIVVIITNNPDASILQKAKNKEIPSFVINSKKYPNENIDEKMSNIFLNYDCDYIFLSGFMKKIEKNLLSAFDNKIINTHPALLPSKYGGKGMYGKFVHEAIIKNGEKKSGVTIHFVNEIYDDGEIILKKEIPLQDDETSNSLETKIKQLEKTAIVEAFVRLLAKS